MEVSIATQIWHLVHEMLISFLRLFFTKNKKLVVFYSKPAYSHNSKALYEYLREHQKDMECVWIVNTAAERGMLKSLGIPCHLKQTWGAVLALARAAFVVSTHGDINLGLGRRAVHVSLWHGFSPKGIGYLRRNASRTRKRALRFSGNRIDLSIAPSPLCRPIISVSRNIPPGRIEVTGHPRNDWLFKNTSQADLSKLFGLDLSTEVNKVVLFAPTFRETKKGEVTGELALSYVEEMVHSRSLRECLKEQRAICIFKLHPKEEAFLPQLRSEIAHPFYVLTSNDLAAAKLDLFEIMGAVDLLICDFSSVYTDYLVLNRPIVFYTPDMDEFSEERGFKLEPIDLWMPGSLASNVEGLTITVKNGLQDPQVFGEERQRVSRLLHQYRDGNSSARVWMEMEKLLPNRRNS
jgi:CDP-glycerol glycerophosphotransferase (TagB/SpsB family)